MKKLGKCLLWFATITFYFNIGWGIGTYLHNNLPKTDNELTAPATTMAKVLAGPKGILATRKSMGPTEEQCLISFTWPLNLFVIAIAWLITGAVFLFKLVFAGGLLKLVDGLGNLLLSLVVFLCIWMLINIWTLGKDQGPDIGQLD